PAVNLFTLKSIGHLIELLEYLNKNKIKNISIIGSGFIGLEAADALGSKGFNITVIEKEEHPLPSAEPEIQLQVEDILKNNKIRCFSSFINLKPNYSDE